jgi:FkbH-like protein
MSTLRKCIVWDLDNTLWDGVLLEGRVALRRPVAEAIRELDGRGILHSIASRGEAGAALSVLRDLDLERYFLVPRINWLPKSQNLVAIAHELDIPPDAVAFVDDDPFEREQMTFMLPDVLAIDAGDAPQLPHMLDFTPGAITAEARGRRESYAREMERRGAATACPTREAFLASCGMILTVRPMQPEDIPRALELMTRTHQLNTTGASIDEQELRGFVLPGACGQRGFVASLDDRWGSLGIIGAAIVEMEPSAWRLRYLAVSCRVLGRGIERAFLAGLLREARRRQVPCAEALFRPTGRNRMMRAFYQMMAFRDTNTQTPDGASVFRADMNRIPGAPEWVELR